MQGGTIIYASIVLEDAHHVVSEAGIIPSLANGKRGVSLDVMILLVKHCELNIEINAICLQVCRILKKASIPFEFPLLHHASLQEASLPLN